MGLYGRSEGRRFPPPFRYLSGLSPKPTYCFDWHEISIPSKSNAKPQPSANEPKQCERSYAADLFAPVRKCPKPLRFGFGTEVASLTRERNGDPR